jgi:DNA helicase II / ATP-dependent DNA helicase PcrA
MARELRIIGPPGCGKTYRLTRLASQAADHYGGENVLICSLTRAAAAEVAGRNSVIPDHNIATLHSFARRALGGPEILSGKRINDWNDWVREQGEELYQLSVTERDTDDAATENTVRGDTIGDRLMELWSVSRARMQPIEQQSDEVRKFAALMGQFKDESGLVDFTDLLELALRDCDFPPGLPHVILVDEAQDVPLLGMQLLRKWAESTREFVICGDPLQNLFHWAGTDWQAFLTPEISDDRKWILAQSYRVPRAVHAHALKWIDPLKREIEAQFGKPIEYNPRRVRIGEDEEGRPVYGDVAEGIVRGMRDTYDAPRGLVTDAQEALAAGKTVMFIAACGYMLNPLIEELRDRGIPFHNPYARKKGCWNPLQGRRDATMAKDRILAFLRPHIDTWGEKADLWSPVDLWRWLEWCQAKQLGLQVSKESIGERAKATFGTLDPMSFERLAETFEPEALEALVDAASAGNLDWLNARIVGAKAKTMQYPMAVAMTRGPQALRERPQVIVGTIHSLKGSEADRVYLIPDLSEAGGNEWCGVGEGHNGILRAFYVAMTRAREELVLCAPASSRAVPL